MDEIHQLLSIENVLSHENQGVLIASFANTNNGLAIAQKLLTKIIDTKSLLLLSGGRTPKGLYTTLAHHESLQPGAVGMVDERYGTKFHKNSNELMLRDSGLLRYLEMRDIPFYPILADKETREETAADYDVMLRELFAIYRQTVGIVGIGLDGHTAGIAGNRRGFHNSLFDSDRKSLMVSEFVDTQGPFGERVTMTFLGLSMLDILLVLVFGDDKKEALDLTFSAGSEEDVPSRFFLRPEIAKKTLVITDQSV